ncbi:hypothetical protein JR316_0007772 [Psilocybe cubensis]|uniref:F-box domain-containing protein n=2 Tax=Psilocybe cubensis TaxID=181762 RepID=A0A8H7XVD9_PSICU|nr:hypothetical protein JR316_0007772 [Psilocybe cubensis]KAH9479186.1 hypothetical protein JR316_0007772 [Psilocybe cubensis]
MSAPLLSSQLGSTYIPNEIELVTIKQHISEHMAELKVLEARVDLALKAYEDLRTQYDTLSLKIDQYKALASPLRRLPTEILAEIFFYCLPTETNSIISPNEAPLILTRVCSKWRKIALTTPIIWSTIHISTPPIDSRNSLTLRDDYISRQVECRTKLVFDWIARSGECPLYISIFIPVNSHPVWAGFEKQVLRCLNSNSHRWKETNFNMPSRYLSDIFAMDRSKFPMLTSLAITVVDLYLLDRPTLAQRHGICEASNLTAVSFENIPEDLTQLPLHWARLHTLSLTCGSRSISDVGKVLESCKSLFRLHIVATPNSSSSYNKTITLPMLNSLILFDTGCNFLDCLDVPSLQYIRYHYTYPEGKGTLLSFIPRVANGLQTLISDFQLLSNEDFLLCLRHCPNLVNLSSCPKPNLAIFVRVSRTQQTPQRHLNFNDALLDLLCTPDSAGRFFLPKLQIIDWGTPAHFSDEKLLEFIHLRRDRSSPGVSKLKRIVVLREHESDNSQMETILKQFNDKDSFKVDIRYAKPSNSRIVLQVDPRLGLPSQLWLS